MRVLAPMLERFSQRLKAAAILPPVPEQFGVSPHALLALGFVLNLGAAAAVVLHANVFAFVFLAFGIVLMEYSIRHLSATVQPYGLGLSAVGLAIIVFGFALADISHALAACFLVLGLLAERVMRIASGTEAMRADAARSSLFEFVVSLSLALACIWPNAFGLASYVCGALGFILAGLVVAARMKMT